MKRIVAMLLTALMLATLVTGCGTGGSNEDVAKDTVTIAVSEAFDTFGVLRASNQTTDYVLTCLYDPLMYFPIGSDEPIMLIAESYEKSEDGLTYTFKIRENATFHDGSAVTSSDAKFSCERLQETTEATFLQDATFETPDDKTFIIRLKTPEPALLRGIYMCRIYCEKAYNEMGEAAYGANPVGSGPYKFVSYETDNKLELTAYEGYYREQPAIKNVIFKYIEDGMANSTALEAGDVQISTYLPNDDLEYLDGLDTVEIHSVQLGTFIDLIGFNVADAPFDNKYFRQMINYATDRAAMINASFNGYADEANFIVYEGCPEYDGNITGYSYNLEKAAECLEKAGYPNGEGLGKITIYGNKERHKVFAQILQSSLREIGVDLEIQILDSAAFTERLVNNDLPFFVNAAGPDSLVGDSYSTFFTSGGYFDYFSSSASGNKYDNSKFDELFAAAKVEPDEEKAKEIYAEIWELANEEALYDPVDFRTTCIGVSSNLDVNKANELRRNDLLDPYYMFYK